MNLLTGGFSGIIGTTAYPKAISNHLCIYLFQNIPCRSNKNTDAEL